MFIAPSRLMLFLFETTTATGPVLAAAIAKSLQNAAKIARGHRQWDNVPIRRIRNAVATQRITRKVVDRGDAAWIHGRGHSVEQKRLSLLRVAVIGCGSIGSELSMLLAKAGIGQLILIDNDRLNSANVSRHLLGSDNIGIKKSLGVCLEVQRHLPHVRTIAVDQKFEHLSPSQLCMISESDLIITAGLDIEGEACVNSWRLNLPHPPVYLSTWVEAYALAGHAVLLFGRDDLLSQFVNERPQFRLTDWPEGAGEVIVEAGCGNVFQPHGATDLLPTVAMAVRLALNALLEEVHSSCRQVWMGDKAAVAARGGHARAEFTHSHTIRTLVWQK